MSNSRIVFLHILPLIVFLFLHNVPTRSAQEDESVTGYRGMIKLESNPARSETVVVVNPQGRSSQRAKQIVLLLQHDPGTAVPATWSGSGRVLVWRRGIAVLGGNRMNKLFRFRSAPLPSSLSKYSFPVAYSIFGIVRYTSDRGFTEQQLENLVEFGELSPAAERVGPERPETCPAACDTGGEGATQCSVWAGGIGCNTSCRSGYYACCWWTQAGQPRCKCCSAL